MLTAIQRSSMKEMNCYDDDYDLDFDDYWPTLRSCQNLILIKP